MEDILSKIASWKKSETIIRKKNAPLESLMDTELYYSSCYGLSARLMESTKPQIIAEFKRKSPSKGIIREPADPASITQAYQNAGASAISVLTDENFFGAQKEDFSQARSNVSLPLLRKDFIIDSYQVHESKSIGADIILLIAAILSPDEVFQLGSIAHELGMEVLLELHSQEEFDRICEPIDIIGINNRNLKTFEVNLDNSKSLVQILPKEYPAIAESGISDPATVKHLFQNGFKGFLIGESFMKTIKPGQSCLEMVKSSQNSF